MKQAKRSARYVDTGPDLGPCDTGKRQYKSKKLAKQATRGGGRKGLKAYRCPECGAFHLTSTDRRAPDLMPAWRVREALDRGNGEV